MLKKNVAVWKMLKDLEDGPPFLCPKCGRTYSHKCNLTRHLRLECGVGPRFQCAWCKKRFKHRHHLRDHQRIHLYSNCTFELRNWDTFSSFTNYLYVYIYIFLYFCSICSIIYFFSIFIYSSIPCLFIYSFVNLFVRSFFFLLSQLRKEKNIFLFELLYYVALNVI